MLERPLRVAAIVVSLLIVVSFALFVVDEVRSASNHTVQEINPSPEQRAVRDRHHGAVRRAIDRADDVVLAPFAGVADGSSSRWVRRSVPALIGLLVWGAGVAFLARFAHGRS